MSHEALMERVLESIQGLDSKLDGISKRLKESEYHIDVCMRGLQVLLLERATKLQVVRSLHEVTEVLLRLEAEALADMEDEPASTRPNNAIPQR
jgi:signal recognition particle GTPase